MRLLDSARFSRRSSQRSTVLLAQWPSAPQGWPWVWRLSSPFSFFPPFSSSWRISLLPPFCYPLFLTISSFVMLSSSSFSFRLFSLSSSPCSISFKVVEQQKKPGARRASDYPTAVGGVPPPAC